MDAQFVFPFAAVMLKKTLYVDLYTDWQDENMQNRTMFLFLLPGKRC